MKHLVLGLTLACATAADAQENTKFFYTRQECAPVPEMVATTTGVYSELPLFSGTGVTFGIDSVPFQGGAMFFVNQDTGTWTLLTLYADGTACMTAVGTDFEPYVE